MKTENYPHKIAAIYPDAQAADAARSIVEAAGLGDVELVHLHADSPHIGHGIEPEQAETCNCFIQDIVLGTGIGTAVGAAGAGAGGSSGGCVGPGGPGGWTGGSPGDGGSTGG